MRCLNRWAFPCLLLALTLMAVSARAAEILVFAAASTKDSIDEISERFAAEGHGAEGHGQVIASFASSSTLAKQIENGAPADLYISADRRWMDYLAERDLIVADSRFNLLGNSLVLIAPRDTDWTIDLAAGAPLVEILGDSRLAMGDPDHVPAGRYGKAALQSLNVWSTIEPKLARAKDVRAALALVERGEAAAGIVYATDAAASDAVRVVDVFPATSHPEIVYPVAIVAGHDEPDVRALYRFLGGPEARAVFERYGFTQRRVGVPSN
ncbi:molybdate ABC transporter substrate-binding protein [Rhodospirillaceae bacterium SYSU D60014]|uniref:molybdate ABC transporter substrate-binding protein n=1 Tax=Virgifigura deserti TaxID=2268457 RepID=UPI000E669610